mmetsp:Transcript_26232/g.102672  ORF Transcript_26232/g.102672 Transcript_26232/m.102672 type:complete len:90 (-) Transcript_26232:499-768(-)
MQTQKMLHRTTIVTAIGGEPLRSSSLVARGSATGFKSIFRTRGDVRLTRKDAADAVVPHELEIYAYWIRTRLVMQNTAKFRFLRTRKLA